MKIWKGSAVALGLLTAHPAWAEKIGSNLDLYYVPLAKLAFSAPGTDADLDGNGWGIKGKANVNRNLFVHGEFQANHYNKVSVCVPGFCGSGTTKDKVSVFRAGFGLIGPSNLFAAVEFVDGKKSGNFVAHRRETGWGIHGGFDGRVAKNFSLSADLGYLDLGDFGDGVEFRIGGALDFSNQFGAFVDFRQTSLSSDEKDTLKDVRAGLRILF